MQQNNPRSILKFVLKKDLSPIQAQGPYVNKVIEIVSPAIQKVERKLCRLCAKLKPVESLFPFFGTEYEQVINKLLFFGLCIKKDDGLPTEICQTCSRKLWNCREIVETFVEADKRLKKLLPSVKGAGATNISNLINDTKSDKVRNNKILFVKIKEETPEMLCEEVVVENQIQLGSERFIHSEIEIKDEMAEMYSTDTDSLNGIINHDCQEVVVKDEHNEIEMTENEEKSNGDTLLDELDIKEEENESDDLEVRDKVETETSENKIDPVDTNPQSGIAWVELFECCDCKKRYITKEAVISHITTIHAKGQVTYHAKFEAVRVNIRKNPTPVGNPASVENSAPVKNPALIENSSEELNRRQIYHHVVRPFANKSEKQLFTCGVCGLTVKRNSILKEHMLRHRRDLNDQAAGIYRCNVCKRTMRSQHLLKCHEDLHNGVKNPFACEKCDDKFSEYRKWYVHQRVHTGDRPFGCKICDKTFRTKQTMKYHVTRVHMREKLYQCLTCKKQFKYMSALTYHMKNLECKRLFSN